MRKRFFLLMGVLFSLPVVSQTNGVVAELRMLGTGTCSTDSGMTHLTYLIRDNILRIDIKSNVANGSVIYQPKEEKMWILFNVEKIYYSMTKSEMDSFQRKVDQVGLEMEKKYEALSDKEKEEQDMLWQKGNPFLPMEYTYNRVKKSDSLVSQLVCEKYRAEMPNNTVRFAYLNDLKTTGIGDEELDILNKFAEFMGPGISTLTGNMDMTIFRKWNEGGYPIFIKSKAGKSICHETWTQFIYRMNIRDESYQIPYDYRKELNPLGN